MPVVAPIDLRGRGMTAFSKPNLVASLSLASACATCRNSADRATSPKNTVRFGAGREAEELAAQLKQTALVSGLVHADVFAALTA